ncbi:MAG: hypothetical protein WCC87_17420 [Candidatus Korobacteraceae bacterium]
MDDATVLIIVLLVVAAVVAFAVVRFRQIKPMAPQERAECQIQLYNEQLAAYNYRMQLAHGPLNPALVCPHCQSKGVVRVKPVTQKMGVSGGKATAALLTGGVSMLATGLSRKQKFTQAHCQNCNSTWMF